METHEEIQQIKTEILHLRVTMEDNARQAAKERAEIRKDMQEVFGSLEHALLGRVDNGGIGLKGRITNNELVARIAIFFSASAIFFSVSVMLGLATLLMWIMTKF